MTLADGREKRSTAGNRMSKLLNAEEEDEFYKTTYGGFDEEGEDRDYASEASVDDDVDSDFDIDENDEVKSDNEDDDKPKRKRPGVNTKAYKEPKKAKHDQPKKPKKSKPKADKSSVQIYHSASMGKKALRHTTSKKTLDTEAKRKEREVRDQLLREYARKRNVAEVRRLTQEELLEEAKHTEEMNLRSLEIYRKMELEKKKARSIKQVYRGPMIRYHSVTMPLIEELPTEAEINVVSDNGNGDSNHLQPVVKPTEFCSRTFITFTEEPTFNEIFHSSLPSAPKIKVPIKQYCPITRLPAKYFDPVTKTPYANAKAFRIIRDAYYQQLESGGTERKDRRKSSLTSSGNASSAL